MGPENIRSLLQSRAQGVDWSGEDKPIAIVDGRLCRVREMDSVEEGSSGYVVGVNDKTFPIACEYLRVETLHFYEMRVSDLTPLAQHLWLRRLAITWNTKVTSINPIGELGGLEVLVLEDTPKVRSLDPIARLHDLVALDYSGGICNKNRAESLDPVGQLQKLEELMLTNLRIDTGGLRPIAKCSRLKHLTVSNQFPTADYAYLSARLPEVDCDMLTPWVRLGQALEGKDIMVVGRRKPFLSSVEDRDRIEKYERQFEKLRTEFLREAEA